MTDYKPGDRVRVTFEAEYDHETDEYYVFFDSKDGETTLTKDSSVVIEKITPDYKAQIEALEPGTAFMLTHAGKEFTYFRTDGDRIINRAEEALDINRAAWLHAVTDIRILK